MVENADWMLINTSWSNSTSFNGCSKLRNRLFFRNKKAETPHFTAGLSANHVECAVWWWKPLFSPEVSRIFNKGLLPFKISITLWSKKEKKKKEINNINTHIVLWFRPQPMIVKHSRTPLFCVNNHALHRSLVWKDKVTWLPSVSLRTAAHRKCIRNDKMFSNTRHSVNVNGPEHRKTEREHVKHFLPEVVFQ